MTMLSSWTDTYLATLAPPIFAISIISISVYFNDRTAIIIAFIMIPLSIIYSLYNYRRWKRIYYDKGRLHIYSLFSNNPVVIIKDNIGGINKSFLTGIYTLVYYDENKNDHYIYFRRSWFADEFKEIIDRLNEVD